jgi:hypothetical protein
LLSPVRYLSHWYLVLQVYWFESELQDLCYSSGRKLSGCDS